MHINDLYPYDYCFMSLSLILCKELGKPSTWVSYTQPV